MAAAAVSAITPFTSADVDPQIKVALRITKMFRTHLLHTSQRIVSRRTASVFRFVNVSVLMPLSRTTGIPDESRRDGPLALTEDVEEDRGDS
jgi:hypothetical protein